MHQKLKHSIDKWHIPFLISLHMSMGWSEQDAAAFWERWPPNSILRYTVSDEQQEILQERRDGCSDTLDIKRHTFVTQNQLQDANGKSIIFTPEADDLLFWALFQSWTFCDACGRLEARKLLPGFQHRNPLPLTSASGG